MRQIKFRGKRLKDGKWIYGSLADYSMRILNTSVKKKIIFDNIVSFATDNFGFVVNDHEVDPETIGQFTGLHDKNGKEVYEGDIIGCHNPDIKHLIFYEEKQGRFMAALNGDIENSFVGVCGLDSSHWNASKEVIGNIHDTPSLISDKQ